MIDVCGNCGLVFEISHDQERRPPKRGVRFCSRACRHAYVSGRVDVRVWERVDRRGDDECWPWLGSKTSYGYGRIQDQGAHRVVYELLVGTIPEGLEIDHLCRVRHCVNPAHMEAVTSAVNTLRGMSIQAQNARKTHCLRGHEFTSENTIVRGGGRACRECKRLANLARRKTPEGRAYKARWERERRKRLKLEAQAREEAA